MKFITHKTIDSAGLHCPQPILRCRAGIRGLAHGEVLHFISSDPCSHPELLGLIARGGHELLEHAREGRAWHYHIRIRHASPMGKPGPARHAPSILDWLSPTVAMAF